MHEKGCLTLWPVSWLVYLAGNDTGKIDPAVDANNNNDDTTWSVLFLVSVSERPIIVRNTFSEVSPTANASPYQWSRRKGSDQ